MEYCLDGLKGQKDKLFNHISTILKPAQQPAKSTDQLKKEVEALKGSTAQKHSLLITIEFIAHQVEKNLILQKAVIGNENSTVAELIKKLGNSDWVKQGLIFLPDEIVNEGEFCPFCQERTITKKLIENIQNYFDKTYEKEIDELKKLLLDYEAGIDLIPNKNAYELNPFIIEKKSEFENLFNDIIHCLNANKTQIVEKLKTPSQIVTLTVHIPFYSAG